MYWAGGVHLGSGRMRQAWHSGMYIMRTEGEALRQAFVPW